MAKHIANILTGCRILGSVLLLFLHAFSVAFYITYIFCGFSDMIDGTIARKTKSNSKFGARFDTVSDFVFVTVSFIKFLPLINIPIWLWVWLLVITVIRIGNIIYGYATKKQFIPPHTVMNKISGLMLFILPLTLSLVELNYSSVVVCLVATFSAIQECDYISKKRNLEG